MGIADNLYFNVFRILQIFFQIYFIIAKGFFSFAFSHVVGSYGFFGAVNNAHTAAAAAGAGLDQKRIADLCRLGAQLFDQDTGQMVREDSLPNLAVPMWVIKSW